jgi:NADH-quinone oxidoreductase subunit G
MILSGGAVQTVPLNGHLEIRSRPELIQSAGNTLYTSGTLGRYSRMLNSVLEAPGALYHDPHKEPFIQKGSVQLETTEKYG